MRLAPVIAPAVVAALLTGLVAHAGARRRAPRVDGPQLRITPEKRALVLARDSGTRVELLLTPAPPQARLPVVSASLGTLGEVSALGGGRFAVDYRVPEAKPPAAAVLIAELRAPEGTWVGATSLLLLGSARVSIETEPNARVHLIVAGQRNGPFVADGAGKLETSLTVPPGVDELQIQAVDQAGNRSRRSKALGVPPFPRLAIGPLPERWSADGSAALELSVAQLDERGALVPFAGRCVAGGQALEPLAPLAGLSRWRWRPQRAAAEPVALRCAAGRGTLEAERLIALHPGPPTQLTLGDATCVVGGSCPLMLTATDRAGNPVTDLDGLTVEASAGAITRTDGDTPPLTFVAPTALTAEPVLVRVRLPALGLEASARIELVRAPVAALRFTDAEQARTRAGDTLRLRVEAVDAFDNPVELGPAEATAERGRAELHAGLDGVELLYTSPAGGGDLVDRIEVRAGEVSAELAIQVDGRWRTTGVGAAAGGLLLRDGSFAPAAELALTSSLAPWDGRLALTLHALVAQVSAVDPVRLDGERLGRVETLHRLLPLCAGLQLRLINTPGFGLELGAGGGVALSWLELTPRGADDRLPPARRARLVTLAADGRVGVGVPLGPGRLIASLHLLWLHTAPLAPYRGDLLGGLLTAGYRLELDGTLY